MEGTNKVAPEPTQKDFPAWEQGASRVLYCLTSGVHDKMLGYINNAKAPTKAWENLKKIFAASTMAQKLQLRQELNNIREWDMSVTNYTTKIKEICNALGSINMTVDEDEMIQIFRLFSAKVRAYLDGDFSTYNQCRWSKKTT